MTSRSLNKHHSFSQGHGHAGAGHPNKAFTSSGVNAEYKAALSVFNDALLSEAHDLLFQAATTKEEDDADAKFKAVYSKCKAACSTIAKTEALPGFLKSHHLHMMNMNIGMAKGKGMGLGLGMHKGSMGKGLNLSMHGGKGLHRSQSSLSQQTQGRASQLSSQLAASQQMKSKQYMMKQRGPMMANMSGSAKSSHFLPAPASLSRSTSSSSDNTALALGAGAGGVPQHRWRSSTPPPSTTSNPAPPKSALKFLEALNRGPDRTPGPPPPTSNKGSNNMNKRKHGVKPTHNSNMKRKRQTLGKEANEDEHGQDTIAKIDKQEFQDLDEDQSSGESAKGDESDASVASSAEDEFKGNSSTRRARQGRAKRSPSEQSSPPTNDGKRRSARTRTRTDALTYEELGTGVGRGGVRKSAQEKSTSTSQSSSSSPPSSPRSSSEQKRTRRSKANAPTEANGDTFAVGDDILVYHEPDDKWYEAIVANVNYVVAEGGEDANNSSNKKTPDSESGSINVESPRRSGRTRRNRNASGNDDNGRKLEILSYDVEYDNGEAEENVLALNVIKRDLDY